MGKRKYISLPLIALALIAIVVIPIIIINSLSSPFPPLATEEQFNEWYMGVSDRIDAIVEENGVTEAIAELDRLIGQAEGNNEALRGLFAIKRSVWLGEGDYEAAIAAQIEVVANAIDPSVRENKQSELAYLYYENGDYALALEAFEKARELALKVYDNAPVFVGFYDEMIETLKAILSEEGA
jgi:tetratricopeptide (TPR) repeat protein